MGLSEIDRNLLERCLQKKSRGWEDFVDRFMGLVVHVVNHSAQARSIRLGLQDRDDLCGGLSGHCQEQLRAAAEFPRPAAWRPI